MWDYSFTLVCKGSWYFIHIFGNQSIRHQLAFNWSIRCVFLKFCDKTRICWKSDGICLDSWLRPCWGPVIVPCKPVGGKALNQLNWARLMQEKILHFLNHNIKHSLRLILLCNKRLSASGIVSDVIHFQKIFIKIYNEEC